MINTLILVLLFLLLPLSGCVSSSQSGVPEPLQRKVIPPKWESYPAVILNHSTDLTFEIREEGNIVKQKDVRWFQVNNRSEEGVEQVAFYWRKTFEEPLVVGAQAFYPDGSRWRLADKDIESEKDPHYNTVTESFHIPGYDRGVIIKIVTEREYFQPEFYGNFVLTSSFPVLERTVSLKLPEDTEILYGVSGEGNNDITTETVVSDGFTVFSLSAASLEPIKEKRFTPFPEEYYPALNVSFPPKGKKSYTWKELGDHYLDLSKSAFEVTDSIRRVANKLNISGDKENLIATIFNEVVQRIRYHGDWNGRFAFFPRDARVVLQNGYGDCKELSTILKSLLQTQGVDSNFVLLSTWNNFQANEGYPNLDNFNHAILAVPIDDKSYRFLDATHSWADSTTSYYASIGRKAFVIRDGESHLTTIKAGSDFTNSVTTHTQILPKESSSKWRAEGTVELKGYSALRFYEKFHYTDETDENSFMRSFLRRYFSISATKVEHKKLTPRHVVFKYSGPFHKQYIPVGKGGFKLDTPMVHTSYVNDHFTDLAGKTYRMPLTQIDSWELPFEPSQHPTDGFTSALGGGSWKYDGATVLRKYSQDEIVIKGSHADYEQWYSKINAFINSSVWR